MSKFTKLESIINKIREKSPNLHLGFGAVKESVYIPTPFPSLNELNGGGLPKGKFGTIAGPAQTGKGTLLLQIIAHNMQINPEFTVLWTDAEGAFEKSWAEKLGVDLSRVIIQKYSDDAPNAERLLDHGLELVKSKAIDLWVIDSIAALMPKAEQDKSIEDGKMLDIQRKLGEFYRKANHYIAQSEGYDGCSCIFIGQIYNVPTTYGVGLEEVRGGNAVKHWAHFRWKIRRGAKDEAPEAIEVIYPDGRKDKMTPGWAQHIKLDKTRINDREAQNIILQFYYGRGLDSTSSAITSLLANNIVVRDGQMYKHSLLPDGKVRGRDATIKFLMENKDIRDKLVEEMTNKLIKEEPKE